jgi:hypothetical protein
LFIFGLRDESVVNILFINVLSYDEYWLGIWPYEPLTIFKARNCKLLAWKGGDNAHI